MDWVKELLEFVVMVTYRRPFSRTGESILDRVKRKFQSWRSAYGKSLDGGVGEEESK